MYLQEEISKIIERSIAGLCGQREPLTLYDPIAYMLSIGGKRLRPRLCLTAYNLFSEEIGTDVIYPAIALELFHEFTLLHDDIMDKSDTRRGQVTVHKKWDDNVAILSGDTMSLLAYQYLGYCRVEVLPKVLDLFTKVAVGVCEGQQYDMDFESMPFITMDDYMSMIGLKTAVLLAGSAKMGAVLAAAPDGACEALYKYGYQLGLAFQITDDYLDTFGDESIFGKKIGGDIVNGKKTWLLVEAFRQADDEHKSQMRQIMVMEDSRRKISAMQSMYVTLGVKDLALKAIDEYYESAMSALEPAGFDGSRMEILSNFANKLLHRDR